MALAHPSPRSSADATRRVERARLAVVVPFEQHSDARAAQVGDGDERRERVRMELLVARAAADRRR